MTYTKNLWITQCTTLIMALATWLLMSAARDSASKPECPSWMEHVNEDQFDPLHKNSDKPLFVFIYEDGNVACKEVTRDRLNRAGFAESIRKKFSCFAVQSTHIPAWVKKNARQHQIPMIALVDVSKNLIYSCEQFHEEIIFNGQFDNFLSACSIQEQALLFKKTSPCSLNESLSQIGRGYARRDHKKNPSFSPYYYTYKYTLNIKNLEAFSEAFVNEWEELSKPVIRPVTQPLPQPVSR